MKHRVILTVGIGSGVLVWLFVLASGYFVNPVLLPFGLFLQPALLLALAAITVLVSVGYCFRLLFVGRTRRNLGLTLAALIGPTRPGGRSQAAQ